MSDLTAHVFHSTLAPRTRRWPPLAAALIVLAALVSGVSWRHAAPVVHAQPPDSVVPDDIHARVHRDGQARVIVELRLPGAFRAEGELGAAGASAQRSDINAARFQVLGRLVGRVHRVLHQYDTVPFVALEIGPDALAELEASPHVHRVMVDSLNHPLLPQSVPLVEGDQMWSRGDDGAGVTVAIVDTGVQTSHPFFGGRVIEEACYSTSSAGVSTSFCPNGQSSQTGPGSGVNCSLSVCFHGTHVAGIAAGNGATAGQSFSGVAKGASIMAVQVFSQFNRDIDCGGPGTAPCAMAYTSDIIKGLERVYALRSLHTFSSVNLSLGGGLFIAPCDSEPEKPIIDNLRSAGIATVIAAGNDGSTSRVSSPGCISSAVSVGSTTKTDTISSFSNMASFVSLLAPGSSIYSSVTGGGFGTASGTSMATPHVTGAFALLKQAVPGATVDQILNALQTTGLPITDQRPGGSATKPRIRVADAGDALAPPSPPDLVESAVGNPPATVAAGGTFSVTDTVTNQGAGPAAASTTRYYLSNDQARSGNDVLLTGSRSLLGLAAGGTSTGTVTVTVPAGTSGTYFVLACADDLGVVVESTEGNNCAASAT